MITDLDKATRLFFLKSIAPCIVTIVLLAVVMFWGYINPKPNTHGTAEWADTNYLEQLYLFRRFSYFPDYRCIRTRISNYYL